MSRIFWDTNLFIYLVEGHPELCPPVMRIAERMRARHDLLVTSTLTVGEVLVKPTERRDETLARRYESFLADPAISVVPFDRAAARHYADFRRDRIKGPDAVQLACAVVGKCDLFITNDDRLSKLAIRGIDFIASIERAGLIL